MISSIFSRLSRVPLCHSARLSIHFVFITFNHLHLPEQTRGELHITESSDMTTQSLFRIGQQIGGRAGTYRITKQLSEFIYFAMYVLYYQPSVVALILIIIISNQQDNLVVIKSVQGHWCLHNERDVLKRFQTRTPTLRPLLDEIEDPVEPPAIVLKYLDDDLTRSSRKQRLTRPKTKYVAKNILEALQVLHEDGYVHTGTLLLDDYTID